jgi:hypothetical protein
MTENQFWTLIEKTIDRDALRDLGEDDYPDPLVQPLTEELEKLSVHEIEEFEEILAKALYDLDGRRFAANAGDSRESDDGFLYCRCWVVANGREYYEAVLADPEKMPKTITEWCEPLLYVARDAWAQKTGKDAEEWDYEPKVSYETGSNEALCSRVADHRGGGDASGHCGPRQALAGSEVC